MNTYTKSTTIGDEKCKVLGIREAYVRKTLLPNNWKKVRIGAFISLTGSATDDNAAPAVETLTRTNFLDEMFFGLTNAENAVPGYGAAYVGAGIFYTGNNPINLRVFSTTNLFYAAGNTDFFRGGFIRPDNVRYGPAPGSQQHLGTSAAQNTSSFATLLRQEITLNDNGTITVGVFNDSENTGFTDVSLLALRAKLADTLDSSATSGTGNPLGWWSTKVPVACPYLYIRAPHFLNRLRIHSWMVTQYA